MAVGSGLSGTTTSVAAGLIFLVSSTGTPGVQRHGKLVTSRRFGV